MIKRDKLIHAFAKHELLKKGDQLNHSEFNQIRQKLRFIARLIVKLQTLSGIQHTLTDFLQPKFYDVFVQAILKLREENQQLALTVGYYIKKLCLIKQAEGIKSGDSNKRVEAKDFMDIYNSSWNDTVASSTVRMQKGAKVNKVVALPSTEDLAKLRRFLDERIAVEADYVTLQKIIISSLILFNKRRPMEVTDIYLADYLMCSANNEESEEVLQYLSPEEKVLAQRYVECHFFNHSAFSTEMDRIVNHVNCNF